MTNPQAPQPAAAVPADLHAAILAPLRVTADAGDWSASHEGLGISSYCGIVDAAGKVIALAVTQSRDYDALPDVRALADGIVQCINGRAAAELVAAAPSANEWKAAMLDKLALTWMDPPIGTPPTEILDNIISWHVEVATDPGVSEQAAKGHEAILALTAQGFAWDREAGKWNRATPQAAPAAQALTDERIVALMREASKGSAINRDGSTTLRFARAIEREVLGVAASTPPAGMALVPLEPTQEMVDAGDAEAPEPWRSGFAREMWSAMLAASPALTVGAPASGQAQARDAAVDLPTLDELMAVIRLYAKNPSPHNEFRVRATLKDTFAAMQPTAQAGDAKGEQG